MKHEEISLVINRPVEEVFAFFSDARNNAKWQTNSGLQALEQVPASPVGVGTLIIETWKFMGRRTETTSEVIEYEPYYKYTRKTIKGSSPIKQGTLLFEPVTDGVKFTFQLEVQASGLFAIAESQLAAALRKSVTASLREAKDLLEKQGVGASA